METVQQITPHIYRVYVPFSTIYTSIFIIITPTGVVVYDFATYPEDIDNYLLPALEQLDLSREQVVAGVVSHNHGDHAGGLARFTQCFPHAKLYAGSRACEARLNGQQVTTVWDWEMIHHCLQFVPIPGHTSDLIALYDTRTKTLLSADGLQAYGIYGPGKWGTNIPYPREHMQAIEKLSNFHLNFLFTSHDYHPCNNFILGQGNSDQFLEHCRMALYILQGYLLDNPHLNPEEAAQAYNESSGLPTVGAKTMAALLECIQTGGI